MIIIYSDGAVQCYVGTEARNMNLQLAERIPAKLRSTRLVRIAALHENHIRLYQFINDTEDIYLCRRAALKITMLEYMMQDLWGFPLDANKHYRSSFPKCRCAKRGEVNCPIHWLLPV